MCEHTKNIVYYGNQVLIKVILMSIWCFIIAEKPFLYKPYRIRVAAKIDRV